MSVRIATAAWADPTEVEARYRYRDGAIWLGRTAAENQVPLGYVDDRHICLVGGTRAGKGTTLIVPTLITWPGSICVLDPKGENATITATRRARGSQFATGMGQTVKVLHPFHAAQVDEEMRGEFNPLDALDPDNEETVDEAGRVADALVVRTDGVKDPFWDESARAMIKALILHVLTAPDFEGMRDLVTVRKLIMRGDWLNYEAVAGEVEADAHGMLWTGLMHNPAFNGLVAGLGHSFRNMILNAPKQYESVLQTANRNTEFIDSPGMQRLLQTSDFKLSELKTRPEGLSLYLCLPQRYMGTHYRWLRMMISLIVTEMEKVRGQPATGHPILMLLDEFAGLKRMEIIENAAAQLAGFGVKMTFVLQSLEQLKGTYKDNWETFLANSGLKVFFNLEDNFSRDYVAKLIGETEVIRELRSSNESVSESEGTSRSISRSQSETHGKSSSTSTSETEGTNSSVSTGKSGGVNSSRTNGTSFNIGESWTPTHYLLQALPGRANEQQSKGKGWSQSTSESESRGWNEGRSDGVSRGTSRSRTDGTSESWTTGTSETEGASHTSSTSRSSGSSENLQKRALVTPDEIGQLFARVDDRSRAAYPGLALVLIAGAPPVALRRVNYYEDYRFIGLFDPNPDYPFTPWRDLLVEGRDLGRSLAEFGLRIGGWTITAGQISAAGDQAAPVLRTGSETPAAWIRVPRLGLIRTVDGGEPPQDPLFSLRHYEDGASLIDPFAEIRPLLIAAPKPLEIAVSKPQVIAAPPPERMQSVSLLIPVIGVLILVAIIATAFIHDRSSNAGPNDNQAAPVSVPVTAVEPPHSAVPPEPVAPPASNPPVTAGTATPAAAPVAAPPPARVSAPSPAPVQAAVPPVEKQSSPPTATNDDPIGAGGNIGVPAWARMNVCVPRRLVENEFWKTPLPDSKMDKFREAVGGFMRADNNPRAEYVIREDAFERFNPANGNVRGLIDLAGAGEACPPGYDTFILKN